MSGAAVAAGPAPLAARLWAYQKERFPLAAYGPMVIVFTASAALFSRLARGEGGFVPPERFVAGAFTALVFFAWLRILDEHKDAEIDRRFRPELPVPRGLVSRAELRRAGLLMLAAALLLNLALAPALLGPIALVALWAALMTREFFVPEWLRARPALYLVSHMAIMPLIDLYTTGLDWLAEGARPPRALLWFLLLTFLNGVVVEIGRKIRSPDQEREGVDTYTGAWGPRMAPRVWLGVLALTASVAAVALRSVGAGPAENGLLLVAALLASVPALGFLRRPAPEWGKRIEAASGAWTIAMYLLLGLGVAGSRTLGLS